MVVAVVVATVLQRVVVAVREVEASLARKLVAETGAAAWLLLDGNHRVAALSALGEPRVRVRYLPVATVEESALEKWSQVNGGRYSAADARAVFRAYFEGNRSPRTVEMPAPVLEETT